MEGQGVSHFVKPAKIKLNVPRIRCFHEKGD